MKLLARLLAIGWAAAATGAGNLCAADELGAAAILARALDQSGGQAAWQRVGAIEMRGRMLAGGQEGSFVAREDALSGRYAATFELGLLEGGQGFDGRDVWARRPGGDVSVIDAPGALAATRDQAWLVARAYWFADRHPAAIHALPQVTDGGRRFDVLEARPAGGGRVELWFDAATNLLARVVTGDSHGTQTEFLSDYRLVDGVQIPFRRLQRRGDPRYDVVMEIDEVAFPESADDGVYAAPESVPADYRFAAGQSRASVPFELAGNHILLDVTINGQRQRFAFDSGGVNLLTRAAADALGLEAVGEIHGQGAGEGSIPISLVKVNSLALGDVTLDDQTFFVAPLDDLGASQGMAFDGLVGYEVLRRFVVEIDYVAQKLVLSEPRQYVYPGTAAPIRLRFADRTPIVTGAIDGIAGEFSIDTGARNALTLTSPFAARHGLLEQYAAGAERVVGWGVGGPVMAHVGRARSLVLGDAQVDYPVTALYSGRRGAFADESLAGNVGGEVLRRFRTTFDYSRRRMYLEPNALHDMPDRFDRSGLALQVDGSDVVVAHVAENSPAARAGLKAGDRLRRIDGQQVTAAAFRDVRARFVESPAGSRITVDYARDGHPGRTDLTLEDLIPPDPREDGSTRRVAAVAS